MIRHFERAIFRFARGFDCIASLRASHRRRLRFESLEDRRVLTTLMVTNLADAAVTGFGQAPGTLRQAIYDANHLSGSDDIEFQPGLHGTIELTVADDNGVGASAIVVSSQITIRGNSSGITIGRSALAIDMRLFRVLPSGDFTFELISLTNGRARGSDGVVAGEDGGEASGGAIYNEGVVHIIQSTLYGNHVLGGNGGSGANGGSARGGAILNEQGTLTLVNSTLSGNSVQSGNGVVVPGSFGGGVFSHNGSIVSHNSTITDSSALVGRGIYVLAEQGVANVDLWSTIIGQADVNIQKREFQAVFTEDGQLNVTGGNNLIRSQGDFQFITVSTDDPLLGPLADNGGPTLTHALAAGSPALSMGDNSAGLTSDQRGLPFSRVAGGAADIGAFELQVTAGPTLYGDYNLDQVVDAADYVLWRKTLGTSVAAYVGADGNGNGAVDAADYDVWRGHFGESTGLATVASAAVESRSGQSVVVVDDGFASVESSNNDGQSLLRIEAAATLFTLPPLAEPLPQNRAVLIEQRGGLLNAVLLKSGRECMAFHDVEMRHGQSAEDSSTVANAWHWDGLWDNWPAGIFPTALFATVP